MSHQRKKKNKNRHESPEEKKQRNELQVLCYSRKPSTVHHGSEKSSRCPGKTLYKFHQRFGSANLLQPAFWGKWAEVPMKRIPRWNNKIKIKQVRQKKIVYVLSPRFQCSTFSLVVMKGGGFLMGFSNFLFACCYDTWRFDLLHYRLIRFTLDETLTAELQGRIQAMDMRCYRKILRISYKDHVTYGEVRPIGPHEDLLTNVKRRKLQWYGHVSRS